ncbi:hypothetical protein DAMA08_047970 [Martiniozyma asiatica (nom. inval.)]|nr:hypothetical protein DAMA08_047970 [Martiniozyma asiatica]
MNIKRFFHHSTRVPRHYSSTFKASDLGKNLAKYDIYALAEKPENNVEMISPDSIIFSNLQVVKSPKSALLLNNQIFEIAVEPEIINNIVVELPNEFLDIFRIVYPKPELLTVGLGSKTRMLGPKTRSALSKLGIRAETSDTRNAALSYDLLATERSPALVGSIMLPPNI